MKQENASHRNISAATAPTCFLRGRAGIRTLKPFSIYEIMIVVTIILILMTLLFPAFTRLKEMAKRINCLNRVRDISLMNQRYAARNNNKSVTTTTVPTKTLRPSGYPGKTYQRWWQAIIGDENPEIGNLEGDWGPTDSVWWKLVCDNVLPSWSIGGDAAKYVNPDLMIGLDKKERDRCKRARALQFPIPYTLINRHGNFGVNCNAGMDLIPFTFDWGDGALDTINSETILLSSIPHPNLRVFMAEYGEDAHDENRFGLIKYKGYNDPINNGWGAVSVGYIPGYGAAGIGKESIENVGYAASVRKNKYFDLVKKDVEEGRHDGYTLHGFFDGHAQAIRAEVVGASQMPKKYGGGFCSNGAGGGDQLKGLYRMVTSAEEDED